MLYGKDALEACRQVLNDVVYCLGGYENKFYLIGGWAVYYLLDRPDRTPEAVGCGRHSYLYFLTTDRSVP